MGENLRDLEEEVLLRVNDFHMVLPLQQTLPLVAGAWGAPVPRAVLERLHDRIPG